MPTSQLSKQDKPRDIYMRDAPKKPPFDTENKPFVLRWGFPILCVVALAARRPG
jgi:hypothetical protein